MSMHLRLSISRSCPRTWMKSQICAWLICVFTDATQMLTSKAKRWPPVSITIIRIRRSAMLPIERASSLKKQGRCTSFLTTTISIMHRERHCACARPSDNTSPHLRRHRSCFRLQFLRARITIEDREKLRTAITPPTRTAQALADRASHDPDGDCGHTALDRARLRHRDFFWLYTTLEPENIAFHRCGMGVSM